MHPACPNKKLNHLQNSFLRRTQFWVRKTFSKPASLKRASLVALPAAISHIETKTVPKMGLPGGPILEKTKEKHFHGKMRPQNRKINSKGRPVQRTKNDNCVQLSNKHYRVGTECRTCETWFQLTFRPEMEPESAHCGISCLRSLAPMRWLQCSTTQATFTNPCSALLRYSLVCFNSTIQLTRYRNDGGIRESSTLLRSLYRSHVLTTFLDPALSAMMKAHLPCLVTVLPRSCSPWGGGTIAIWLPTIRWPIGSTGPV